MVDTIKAVVIYVTAALVALGGLAALYLSRTDSTASDTRVVIAGFVGLSLSFLYGQEVQTRTARQTSAAQTAGQASNGGAHVGGLS